MTRWLRYSDVVPGPPYPTDRNVPPLDEPDEEPMTAATMAARTTRGMKIHSAT
jgi:hypothetical protein